jgi:hypothetical protein
MRLAVIPVILFACIACGGSDNSGPSEAVLNITNAAIVSPANSSSIAIPSGGRVHYFNKDAVAHQITSNCPDLNMAAPLAPGGNQLQPVMTGPLSCSLNDASGNAALVANVTVNSPATPGGGGGGGGGGGSGY